jgi:phage tail-like protein
MPIGEDALAGYTFSIEIDGIEIAQFKEVSGISAEIQTIEHRENKKGGLPLMKKLPGARKYGDLTLKRGRTNSKALWDWIKKVQDGNIDDARKNGSVVLFDYTAMGAGTEVSRFNFLNAWPSKVTIGSLQAGGSDVLLEECTITHEGIAPA